MSDFLKPNQPNLPQSNDVGSVRDQAQSKKSRPEERSDANLQEMTPDLSRRLSADQVMGQMNLIASQARQAILSAQKSPQTKSIEAIMAQFGQISPESILQEQEQLKPSITQGVASELGPNYAKQKSLIDETAINMWLAQKLGTPHIATA